MLINRYKQQAMNIRAQQICFSTGDVIADRFEIVKPLREGCQGAIYLVRHIDFPERLIAMKVLLLSEQEDFEVTAARFRNEVMAAYSVTHPNVVRIYDYIRQGTLLAFTMEYIIGGDLADLLAHDEPLKFYQIIHILEQVCNGLSAVHEQNIIHRDIKPENILITKDGQVKISDFGTARLGATLGKNNGITGTVGYLSPEYIRDGHLDLRSDLYSLGVVAYEMIVGELPFQGENLLESVSERLKGDAPSVLEKNDKCPEKLAKIINRLLQLNPDDRYQSAKEVLEDLTRVRIKRINAAGKENITRTQVLNMEEVRREFNKGINRELEIPSINSSNSNIEASHTREGIDEEIRSTRIDLEIKDSPWTDTINEYIRPPVTYFQYFVFTVLTIIGFAIGLVLTGMH